MPEGDGDDESGAAAVSSFGFGDEGEDVCVEVVVTEVVAIDDEARSRSPGESS